MAPDWATFEKYVCDLMEKEHIPGLAVAVSLNGTVIYQKGFGYRDIENKVQVTPETIFGTASVTKSFTAAAIMKLEEAHKLSVNDPVIKYIPELSIPGFDPIDQIKIHHLLSHTTGLPPIQRKEEINHLEEHLSYLGSLSVTPFGNPGDYFSYSNDAFILLGLIIERVTGSLYRRYITQHFLERLGMNRSTMSVEELKKFNNVTIPYTYHKNTDHYESHEWPALGNYEVGGGIRSTVLDLLKYGHLYVDTPTQNKYLGKMWVPKFKIFRNSAYGYALKVTPYKEVTLVEHSGGQAGVSSNFGFVPEKNLVVAVLTNATGAPAEDIWLAAVNTVLGIPTEEKAWIEPEYHMSFMDEEHFIGTYESGEGSKIEIKRDRNLLFAVIDGEACELRASDKRTFVIKEWEYPIPFYCDENGRPWAAFFGMRLLRKNK
jgi:CubicO group peptidase (beta-lactamase class C family)